MNWFTRKDDPVSIFKKQLVGAVTVGDVELLETIIKTDLDMPPKCYARALEQAIKNDQVRMVDVIIQNKKGIPVDMHVLRNVVFESQSAMFRVLSESFDFQSVVWVRQDNDDFSYKLRLRCMKKDLRCDQLTEALEDMKKLLLEKNNGVLPPGIAEKIKKLDNKGGFQL